MYRTIVADDDPEFRVWIRSLLDNNQDFQVVGEAGSGRETLHLTKLLIPDLVLVDMYMPDLDGLEVNLRIRRYLQNIKVILVSAYNDRVYERLAAEEGALAFIPKESLSLNALRKALQKGK
jgi:two-component system response regulator FimZ (fimbrial Z protein)/two-component system response regulator EvgA